MQNLLMEQVLPDARNMLAPMMMARAAQQQNPLAAVYGQGDPAAVHSGGGLNALAAASASNAPFPADERDLLAKTLMAEAGGEGIEGMIAAGAVIANRVRARGYGEDLRGVIMKPGQFSAWNGVTGYAGGEGAINMGNLTPSQAAYQAADAIISGKYSDPTGGATHYYNPSVANPNWGQRAGGNWQTIGNHVFGFGDGRPGQG